MTTILIEDVLDQLQTDLQSNYVTSFGGDGTINVVYSYRTAPLTLSKAVSLSYQGRGYERQNRVTAVHFDVVCAVMTQVALGTNGKPTEAGLETAEAELNAIEDAIYTLCVPSAGKYSTAYWNSISAPFNSVRPPSPFEMPGFRYAEIPLRIHVKNAVKRLGG